MVKDAAQAKYVLEHTMSGGVGGKLVISQAVVEAVAGLAARQIEGVHDLGGSRLIGFGDDARRGLSAEDGQLEAAVDLDIVIDYGCDIRAVADALRHRVAEEVNRLAGRKVVEVNINVVGIHVGTGDEGPAPERRVL